MNRIVVSFLMLSAYAGLRESAAAENVYIKDVPDYSWYAGCFGTASGNLMGYWDRHGLSDLYTGPTAGGVAPLNSNGSNNGIRSLWASKAGFDGRPADKPGHIDDYWTFFVNDQAYSYESTAQDPYKIAGRPEHEPDSTCDFMGSSQNKWTNLDGECSGNIDAFSFNFWDKQGAMRVNFTTSTQDGQPIRDVQSGLRNFSKFRGYEVNVGSQLVDFNPTVPIGSGFTFENLKAEILRGYPVIVLLQNPGEMSRNLPGMTRANPNIHAMLAYGFAATDDGDQLVRYRTSWGDGGNWARWSSDVWEAQMTVRGVLVFHPVPKITTIERGNGKLIVSWHGPNSGLYDEMNQIDTPAHVYQLQRSNSLGGEFVNVGDPTNDTKIMIDDPSGDQGFFRLKLSTPAYDGVGG